MVTPTGRLHDTEARGSTIPKQNLAKVEWDHLDPCELSTIHSDESGRTSDNSVNKRMGEASTKCPWLG